MFSRGSPRWSQGLFESSPTSTPRSAFLADRKHSWAGRKLFLPQAVQGEARDVLSLSQQPTIMSTLGAPRPPTPRPSLILRPSPPSSALTGPHLAPPCPCQPSSSADPALPWPPQNWKQWHKDTPKGVHSDDANTPDAWIKRHPGLVRLTGKHPLNCEPELTTLMECGFNTPPGKRATSGRLVNASRQPLCLEDDSSRLARSRTPVATPMSQRSTTFATTARCPASSGRSTGSS